MMRRDIVLIPIYKNIIDKYEVRSFRQCCQILGKHDICLITFSKLDCSSYYSIAEKYCVKLLRENFDKVYFEGIAGYNRLMLSKCLYERFSNYQYMLVYQLDAFVFRDELNYWCNLGYDYLGAPISENVLEVVKHNYYNTFKEDLFLEKAFNGGASLRKIDSFNKALVRNSNFVSLLLSNGFNEDIIFSIIFKNQKDISEKECLNFSIESFPSECYEKINRRLPMLCHAWSRKDGGMYDFEFWLKFIMPTAYYQISIKKKLKKICKNYKKMILQLPKLTRQVFS